MDPLFGHRPGLLAHGPPVDSGVLQVDALAGEPLGVLADHSLDLGLDHADRQRQRVALAELVEQGLLALLAAGARLLGLEPVAHGGAQLVEALEAAELAGELVVQVGQLALLDPADLELEAPLPDLAVVLVHAGEVALLALLASGQRQRELLPDGLGADLDVDRVHLRLGRLGVVGLGLLGDLRLGRPGVRLGGLTDADRDEVALGGRPLDRNPVTRPAAQLLERLVHLLVGRLGRRIGQVEVLDVAELDLRPHLDVGLEHQRPAVLAVLDAGELRLGERIELLLRLGLAPVARHQALDHLLVDLLAEALAHHLGRHLARAEAGDLHLLGVIPDDALGLRVDRGGRDLDDELFAAGPDVFDGSYDAHIVGGCGPRLFVIFRWERGSGACGMRRWGGALCAKGGTRTPNPITRD